MLYSTCLFHFPLLNIFQSSIGRIQENGIDFSNLAARSFDEPPTPPPFVDELTSLVLPQAAFRVYGT
jgi:hypothetical protein